MDWSSIYENTGEEPGDWYGLTGRLQPLLVKVASRGKYGVWSCYSFTVNYVLGVGCLGIPYAFLQGGVIFGIGLVMTTTGITLVTVLWVAESLLRAQHLHEQLEGYSVKGKELRRINPPLTVPPNWREEVYLLEEPSLRSYALTENMKAAIADTHQLLQRSISSPKSATNMDLERSFEVTELCEYFLGTSGKVAYQLSLMMLMYVGLLAYTQVFVKTSTSQVGGIPGFIPCALFGAIVVPLSCIDLAEQVFIQVAMAILRFVSLAIMIFGTLVAVFMDPTDAGIHRTHAPYVEYPSFIHFSGFGVLFSTALFSQLFQHSVPGLIQPLSHTDKRHVPTIFAGALLTTAGLYIFLGVMCVIYFGDATQQSINLNFSNFDWGCSSRGCSPAAASITRSLAMVVVLFPALDVLSVFPLIANTLGNNLAAALQRYRKKICKATGRKISKRAYTIFWRLVAAVPPVLLSAYAKDLSLTLQFAGLFGVYVALVTPALLQRSSSLRISKALGPSSVHTVYSTPFSKVEYTYVVLAVVVLAVGVCGKQIIQALQG